MNVNWDDEIPNIWENKIDGNQTTNQSNKSNVISLSSNHHQVEQTIPTNMSPPSQEPSRLAALGALGKFQLRLFKTHQHSSKPYIKALYYLDISNL